MMMIESAATDGGSVRQYARSKTELTKAVYVNTVEQALEILGATDTEIRVYRRLATPTDQGAWQGPDAYPMNHRLQADMVEEQGISDRHWRRIESKLEAWGAIERATADNGYRGRHMVGGRVVRLGISLRPSIDNMAYFESLVAERQYHKERHREAMWLARATRRRVKKKVAALPDHEAAPYVRRLDEIDTLCPSGARRQASADALTDFRLALCSLEQALDTRLGSPGDNLSNWTSMSGAPDSDVRCHIQYTTQPNYVTCNEQSPTQRTPDLSGEVTQAAASPGGDAHCLENKHLANGSTVNTDLLSRLTPANIKGIASEDFEIYLDAFEHPEEAITTYLRELGINVQAWEAAVAQMGLRGAFIALAVIDRNRLHPTRPVISPGGTLRKFTDLHRQGRLNLTRSIIGIWERERAGIQPRSKRCPIN
jgi:replication initiation protein RepC